MSLSKLPDDIRPLIARLPYRVGLYISQSDQSGGAESAAAEMAALGNVVTYFVEDFCKSEFAQDVMMETLRQKNDWADWRDGLDQVPEECNRVVDALIGIVDMKDIVAFKNNLLEIAIAVAVAYREFSITDPLLKRMKIYLVALLERILTPFSGASPQSFDQILNVSRAEKAAINRLAGVLDIPYKAG